MGFLWTAFMDEEKAKARPSFILQSFCSVSLSSRKAMQRSPTLVPPSQNMLHKLQFLQKTRRGSPVDRRPSTAEAPPRGEIYPFSKMAVTFEPLIGF